jgi:hypothetical protein
VAYPGDWTNVVALVIVNDCVVTAFTGGGIYKSCDGLNLGDGGNTVKLYEGVRVSEMIACREGGLRVMFKSGDCYTDPSGDHPAGGLAPIIAFPPTSAPGRFFPHPRFFGAVGGGFLRF